LVINGKRNNLCHENPLTMGCNCKDETVIDFMEKYQTSRNPVTQCLLEAMGELDNLRGQENPTDHQRIVFYRETHTKIESLIKFFETRIGPIEAVKEIDQNGEI
jgi:hypothetical protein